MRILIALIFFAATPLAAQDVTSPQLFSFEGGVVCAPETIGTSPAPGTVAGTINSIAESPPFVSNGRRVPAVLGIGFGVKAMANDPIGIDPVLMTITHPPMGRDKTKVQSFATRIAGDDPSLTFYQFDFAYELLPGTWTMEATQSNTVIYRTTFKVVPPNQIPELAAICGFEDMLS